MIRSTKKMCSKNKKFIQKNGKMALYKASAFSVINKWNKQMFKNELISY